MTEIIEALFNQLKDISYQQFREIGRKTPISYPVDYFGFHIGSPERMPWKDGNLTPNYKHFLEKGFEGISRELTEAISKTEDPKKKAYGKQMLEIVEGWSAVCQEYRETVKDNVKLYQALQQVPARGARTFYEACLFLIICIYFLRITEVSHLGLGRFDQYMFEYYQADKSRGVPEEELLETLEAFFISLNYDTDIYVGVQRGDNGQSMVLGGFDSDGNSMYNALSEMCLQASEELQLIDPKINLRVGKNTPDALYMRATRLTKQGLGFPQYCNDDVVVPGLLKLGYDPEDAWNYVVAACWEYIIPNCGGEIPNLDTMNFPLVVSRTVEEKLPVCDDFSCLMEYVEQAIGEECDRIIASHWGTLRGKLPELSLFIDGCIQQLTDVWAGAKYRNFGCHGTGIANAADALAAIKKCVFEEKSLTASKLLDALHHNFEGYSQVRNMLRSCPKMGNHDDGVDTIASCLMGAFSRNMNRRDNGIGGVWRAGTGSAMEYLWSAEKCPATADGRMASQPYSSSFSPSLDVKTNGLLSVILSFTKYDMTEIINGGPLTLEIHDTLFRNQMGMEKVALLVKQYIWLGGHQLQLNAVNRERLLDAQKNPEKYPNLIVRVWGWSGYFNELDAVYQNHIIRRCEYTD